MSKKIAVIGAGGLAREVAWVIDRITEKTGEWEMIGFLDKQPPEGATLEGFPILDEQAFLSALRKDVCVACAIGSAKLREKVLEKYLGHPHISFPVLVDPSAQIHRNAVLEKGVVICAGNVITTNVHIHEFVYLNLNCTVGHDSVIGRCAVINPGTNVSGNVTIGSGTEIGTNTSIIQGITVGEHVVIGAGAAVIRDLPSHCTAVGCPAKPLPDRH